MTVVVAAVVCLQIGIGLPQGLAGARTNHAYQVRAARVVVNLNDYPVTFASASLATALWSPAFVEQMAHEAKLHRLSLFATDAVAEYRAQGLITDPSPPSTSIVTPRNGAVLKGSSFLHAVASDGFGISTVEFDITGEGLGDAVIIKARPYPYGWVGVWHSTAVPNGLYSLQSVASNDTGHVTRSRPVSIEVENR